MDDEDASDDQSLSRFLSFYYCVAVAVIVVLQTTGSDSYLRDVAGKASALLIPFAGVIVVSWLDGVWRRLR
jgi:hypothetical protein